MKWKIASALAVAVLSGARALAADQVALGPPPPWARPASLPAASSAPGAAAVRVLQADHQVHFGADGGAVYSEDMIRVQTPQGLEALSSITLPWNPEFGGITVHKVQILRDGQAIDLLAKQKFMVLRRENRLENAVLDGVLTAVLQPEDLRVGDVLDLSYTVTNADPALAGRQQWGLVVPNAPIDDLKLSAESERGVRWRVSEGLDGATPGPRGTGKAMSLEMKDVQPIQPPAGAPPRFRRGRYLELSDFNSWAEVSAIMAPLFAKAAVIPAASPLDAEVARIRAASHDPKARAEMALALVQDQIRYIALDINDGGLVPADAATTWTRRFGDCKGKTALLVALLQALGIDAQPSLISVNGGDGLDERLPSVGDFDHVLVRSVIGGKVYWLDGTRQGDRRLDDIEVPNFHWTLPVQPSGATLVKLVLPQPARAREVMILRLDASGGLDAPAPAHAESIVRGDGAVVLNAGISNLAPAQRDAALKGYWTKLYGFVTAKTVSASFDPVAREERITLDGEARMDWAPGRPVGRFYEVAQARMGWDADFNREPGPHADAPFAVPYPAYIEAVETVVLPNKGQGFFIQGGDLDQKLAGRAFLRKVRIENGVFTAELSSRSLQPEFPAAEAAADAKALKDMFKAGIYIGAPADYRMTRRELDQAEQADLTTYDEFVKRAGQFLARQRYAQAKADYARATALDAGSASALAGLADAKAMLGDLAGAHADLKKALALKPDDPAVLGVAAAIANLEDDHAGAAADYARILAKAPDNGPARLGRAQAYWAMGDADRALADADALIAADAKDLAAREFRVDVLIGARAADRALQEADAAVAAAPTSPFGHLLKGNVLVFMGRDAQGQGEYDKAAELQPDAAGRIARARYRPLADQKGRLADAEAALKLEPGNLQALILRADAEARMGDFAKALADVGAVLVKDADNAGAHEQRAFIYARSGRTQEALADIDWARGRLDDDGVAWNNLCYDQAMWNLSLDRAKADCDKALALLPHAPAFLDSRAFVFLRQGRLDDAIAEYDRALKADRWLASSLYGRGVAELRQGMATAGRADLDAARALQPRIDEEFADYGVTPPAS